MTQQGNIHLPNWAIYLWWRCLGFYTWIPELDLPTLLLECLLVHLFLPNTEVKGPSALAQRSHIMQNLLYDCLFLAIQCISGVTVGSTSFNYNLLSLLCQKYEFNHKVIFKNTSVMSQGALTVHWSLSQLGDQTWINNLLFMGFHAMICVVFADNCVGLFGLFF